jgi:hypothetical protein
MLSSFQYLLLFKTFGLPFKFKQLFLVADFLKPLAFLLDFQLPFGFDF